MGKETECMGYGGSAPIRAPGFLGEGIMLDKKEKVEAMDMAIRLASITGKDFEDYYNRIIYLLEKEDKGGK